MHSDIDRVLISHDRIAKRVREMAQQITTDLNGPSAGGNGGQVTIIPILSGAMIFAADLMRQLPMRMKIGLLTVSSYRGGTSSQGSTLLDQQLGDIRGRNVLLIDDILDSGGTLQLVRPLLESFAPASLRIAVLLRKRRPDAQSLRVDYVGFDIPDEFVVGYGLDYGDYYRNLPEIVTLKRHLLPSPAAR